MNETPTPTPTPTPPAPPVPPVPPVEPGPVRASPVGAGAAGRRRRPRRAAIVAGAGVVLVVVAGIVTVLLWPSGPPSAGPVARTEAEAPLVTEAGHVPLPLSEGPRDFLAGFTAAVQDGDVDWLLVRLNPAVIQRYGEDQCRSYLRSSVIDPTMRLQVSGVTGPGTWQWSTDGRSTVVDEVYRVDAHRFLRGSETTGNLWLANVDGNLTWFADCGTPQRG